MLLLAFRSHIVIEDSVDAICLADTARACVCCFFTTFLCVHAPFDAIASFHCNYMFSLKAFPVQKNTSWEYIGLVS